LDTVRLVRTNQI